jgi:pyruvate/2-oxoglutarate dehydrogenase complex dihydrolipoamide dehydrogenase (E3) component
VIIGGGYICLEMAEALTTRGLGVTLLEQLPQLLPRTLDPELSAHVETEMRRHGMQVHTATAVRNVERRDGSLRVYGDDGRSWDGGLLLVVTGVRPDSDLADKAGAQLGIRGGLRR